MYKKIADISKRAAKLKKIKMGIARAESPEIIEAMCRCDDMGLIEPVLVGSREKILRVMLENNVKRNWGVIDCVSDEDVMKTIVSLVEEGEIKGIVKGQINSSSFMHAIVKSKMINKEGFIHHMGVYELPAFKKVFFTTDSGINILPTEEQKEKMLCNCVKAMRALGIQVPKVAFLSANEKVTPKMPSTVHAKNMADKYNSETCIVEGPIAYDVAISKEKAEHKQIDSKVSEDVDLFIYPNIEAGNIVAKCWVNLCNAKTCGVVLGCEIPISMGSRADTVETKINSIALAKLIASAL